MICSGVVIYLLAGGMEMKGSTERLWPAIEGVWCTDFIVRELLSPAKALDAPATPKVMNP